MTVSSLMFVQYPNLADESEVINLMKSYLTKPTDYIQIGTNNLYQQFPNIRHIMVGDSIKAIQSRITQAKTTLAYAIAYDFEHWTATPVLEQMRPVHSEINAANLVHASSHKFAYAPDAKYLHDNYTKDAWALVDIAWLQTGYNANKLEDFKVFLKNVVTVIRSKKPNIEIICQLSLGTMSDKTINDPVKQFNLSVDYAVSLGITGISIVYLDPTKSKNFTIPNLEAILTHISTLR